MRNRVVLAVVVVVLGVCISLLWMNKGSGRIRPYDGLVSIPEGNVREHSLTMNGVVLQPAEAHDFAVADLQIAEAGQPLEFSGWFDLADDYHNSLPRFEGSEEFSGLLILGLHAHIDGSAEVTVTPIVLPHVLDDDTDRLSFQGAGTAPSVAGVYHISVALFKDASQPATPLFQSFIKIVDSEEAD